MAERQNLDVLIGIAHRHQPHEGEHAGARRVGQSHYPAKAGQGVTQLQIKVVHA
jgi:hypothetical protein